MTHAPALGGHAVRRALAAGGAPAAWRRSATAATRAVTALDSACDAVVGLAGQRPAVWVEPTFGATIEAIVAAQAGAAAPDGDRRGTRRRRQPRARTDDGATTPAPPGITAAATRPPPRRRTPAPPGRTTAPRRSGPPAEGVDAARALPLRLDQPALRRRSGLLPAAAAGTPRRTAPPAPGRAAPSAGRRTPPPPPAGAATPNPALQRAAALIGVPAGRLADIAATTPRPGPAAPHALLAGLSGARAGADGSGQTSPSPQPAPVQHPAPPPAAGDRGLATPEPGSRPGPRRPAAAQPGGASPAAGQAPGTAADARTDHDPAASRSAVGRVSTHTELPHVPDRQRSTAPRADDDGDHPGPHAGASGDGDDHANGDDLERRMKQVLDDAARRHGIEV